MVSTHLSIGSQYDFQPQIAKTPTLEPILQFSSRQPEQVTKLKPKRSPRAAPIPLQIGGNPGLDPEVSCWVSLGTKWCPKMVSQRYPKWCPKVPKRTPRLSKWSLQASQITGLRALPVNSQQSRNPWLRGRRQGAKAIV